MLQALYYRMKPAAKTYRVTGLVGFVPSQVNEKQRYYCHKFKIEKRPIYNNNNNNNNIENRQYINRLFVFSKYLEQIMYVPFMFLLLFLQTLLLTLPMHCVFSTSRFFVY